MNNKKLINNFIKLDGLILLFAFLFIGCPQKKDVQIDIPILDGISIVKVSAGIYNCKENGVTEIDTNETALTVEFAENYAGLSVIVQGEAAAVAGKTAASKKISNITEEGTEVKIEAKAQGKKDKTFKFILKRKKSLEIIIEDVKLKGKPCVENGHVYVEEEDAALTVRFAENYAGLSVKVNNAPAAVTGNTAAARVTGISEAGIGVTIEASADGKTAKTFKFTAKKNTNTLPKAQISQLIFEAENINPEAGVGLTERKVYSSHEKPFLKDIAEDGSTNVGTTSSPELNVFIRYVEDGEERLLNVENKTNSKSGQSKELEYDESIKVPIKLSVGDNNLVITYTEKDKEPLVFKVIVTHRELEYKPIIRIQVAANIDTHDWKTYSTDEDFAILEAGSDVISIVAKTEVPLRIEMPERWYVDEGWEISLDSTVIPKNEFTKNPIGFYSSYIAEKNLKLQNHGTKKFVISFTNSQRGYSKKYSFSIKQTEVIKLQYAWLIDFATKNLIQRNFFSEYEFDGTKGSYKAKQPIEVEAGIPKVILFITSEDTGAAVKYAYSETEKDYTGIASSEWKEISRQSFSYNWMNFPQTADGYPAEQEIKTGIQYLYILLENNGVKTCYVTTVDKK